MYVKWKAVNGPTRSASSFKACPEAFFFFNGTSCKGVILFLNNWYLPLFKNNLGSQTAIKDQKSLPQCQCMPMPHIRSIQVFKQCLRVLHKKTLGSETQSVSWNCGKAELLELLSPPPFNQKFGGAQGR